MKYCYTILLFFTFLQLQAQGKVKFYAEANAKQVVIGRYFEVDFILTNADGSDFEPPAFKDFDILSGPNQSISSTSINGRWSRELRYSFTLQPKRIGAFTIGPASFTVRGKKLKSNPVKIEVLKGRAGATSQNDLQKKMEEQVFIRAVPSTSEAYVGQQITIDYKLYTTLDIATYNLLAESEYAGFFIQDVNSAHYSSVSEVVDGIQYATQVIKRVVIFPQQGGLKTIDPFSIQLAVIVDGSQPRRRRGFFGGRSPATTRLVVNTDPLKINVRPFPPDAPPSFTGAVGKNYLQSISTSSERLSTDDVITINMSIIGDGDIKQVQAPKIEVDENLEAYEPRITFEQLTQESGVNYEKRIEYIFLPKKPGTYDIQPKFTYFNTDSLKYITLGLEPRTFYVKQGVKKRSEINRPGEEAVAQEIRDIKAVTDLSQKGSGFFASPIYWLLMLLPVLAFGGVVVYRQKQIRAGNIDLSILKKQQAVAVAKKHLESAQQFLSNNDSRSFYNEVSRASLGYIGDKFNIPLSELSKTNIEGHLQRLHISTPRIQSFIQILKTCEMALYGGMNNTAAMQETYQNAAEVISGIEEEINK